jgi:hypothetical protein
MDDWRAMMVILKTNIEIHHRTLESNDANLT